MPATNFFQLGDFDDEIRRKIASQEVPTETLFSELMADLKKIRAVDVSTIRDLFEELSELPTDKEYQNYLNHPIRLAASAARQFPERFNTAWAVLAFVHNSLEVGYLERLSPRFRDSWTLDAVQRLTIDRGREKDHSYRKAFYDGIDAHSHELTLLKTLDKLDNTLWWVKFDIEQYHADVVLDEVCPRVRRIDPTLSEYLAKLVHYTRDGATKRKFAEAT